MRRHRYYSESIPPNTIDFPRTQTFSRELCIWAKLQHENVLRLIGMVTCYGTPALASEWMENGTMNEYLNEHEGVDVLELVRF